MTLHEVIKCEDQHGDPYEKWMKITIGNYYKHHNRLKLYGSNILCSFYILLFVCRLISCLIFISGFCSFFCFVRFLFCCIFFISRVFGFFWGGVPFYSNPSLLKESRSLSCQECWFRVTQIYNFRSS